MRAVVLAALLAAVTCHVIDVKTSERQQWPWRDNQVYTYEVESYNLARLEEGNSTGNAFQARLVIRTKSNGQFQARLENPRHSPINQELPQNQKLNLKRVDGLDKPFQFSTNGGRIVSLSVPSSLSLVHENMLKGLLSTLQVDLSPKRIIGKLNRLDEATKEGQFKKMETDVTGDCSTLYTSSPASTEWAREFKNRPWKSEPLEITKTKNYAHCHRRVAYHFGVPVQAEWIGTADSQKRQAISQSGSARLLVNRNGPIYKAETYSRVNVAPHFYGKQKAEVLSSNKLVLIDQNEDNQPEWQMSEEKRTVKSLLYSINNKQVEHAQHESYEEVDLDNQSGEDRRRTPRSAENRQMKTEHMLKVVRAASNKRASNEDSGSDETYVDDINLYNDPAYAHIFMEPQPNTDEKQNPMRVQKLAQEAAQMLQNPNNMPKADFLSKFIILTRLIQSMSFQQLTQVSRGMEAAKNSNNNVKVDMWMIYRDAVIQAGNLPAFKQIQSWIQQNKLQGQEAAETISALAETLRYPTKEVMMQFFNLALSPKVSEQQYLNSSALLAATTLINIAQVNNATARTRYPTYIYGRFTPKYDEFVLREVLPTLQQKLEKAIEEQDISKAQVYIKAIGNVGHRAILDVFAPYFDGRIQVSNYLRTYMLANLRQLAYQRDEQLRSVLYSIMMNPSEPYEARVAAIKNLIVSHPTSAMMQEMAMRSHNDKSIQVRAALKTAILSAAQLKSPEHSQLARTAQAASPTLTKEEFGDFYSAYDIEDLDRDTQAIYFNIGSSDNLISKFMKYTQKNNKAAWNDMEASVSSVQAFLEYMGQQMNKMIKNEQSESGININLKYDAQKIAEILQMKREPQEPLNGNLYMNFMQQQRYLTFNEDTLKQIPAMVKQMLLKLKEGVSTHYTKVFNQAQINIMFPLATGMPFLYKYKEPTVVHVQAKTQGELFDFLSMKSKSEIQLTYARNYDGSVGFVDIFENANVAAGVVNKLQVNVPVKIELDIKPNEVKIQLEPATPNQDTTLVHYSVWPYTTIQSTSSVIPVSLNPLTTPISRARKTVTVDEKYQSLLGENLGAQFQLQGYSYSNDYTRQNDMRLEELFTQNDIALTHFNLKYLGKKSENKKLTITAAYRDYQAKQERNSESEQLSNKKQEDVTPNSRTRQEEMAKRVASGIKAGQSKVIDISAALEGPKKTEFVLTAAMADSPVDNKINYAFFAAINKKQYNGVGTVNKAQLNAMNYETAIKNNLKMEFNGEIQSEASKIRVTGSTERSKEYTEYLQKHRMAKTCKEEMAQNNRYQEACHNMLVLAHAADNMKASVFYDSLNPTLLNYISKIANLGERFGMWRSNYNVKWQALAKPPHKGRIDVQASIKDNVVNVDTDYVDAKINLPLRPETMTRFVSNYNPFTAMERVENYEGNHMYQPFCSVDANKIRTFSGRSYEYTLPNTWHVVMQSAQNNGNKKPEGLVVLARRPNQEKQEIYISSQSPLGDFEMHIKPTSEGQAEVNAKTNAKKQTQDSLTTYSNNESPLLQYYTQPDGVLMINIMDDSLRAMYDGQRLVIMTDENRNSTRGICGIMSGDAQDDYLTPQGLLVDRSRAFAASYALLNEESDGKTKEFAMEAKSGYRYRNKYTNIQKSSQDWENEKQKEQQKSYSHVAKSYKQGACEMSQQVQYHERNGEICVSTRPVNACSLECLEAEDFSMEEVEMQCKPQSSQAFQEFKAQIRQGANPAVKEAGTQRTIKYSVPNTCVRAN